MSKRIERELALLAEGGQKTTLVPGKWSSNDVQCVIYHDVPSSGGEKGLPATADIIVPVPSGYPASTIDFAGLRVGSPFLGRVVGAIDAHGSIEANGLQWQVVSYHPHTGGGGPPWDPMAHGFHTYVTELLVWLSKTKEI